MDAIELKVKMTLAVLYETEKNYTGAIEVLQSIVQKIDPADLNLLGSLHNDLGQVAEKAGHYDEAAHYYEQAIEYLTGLKGDAYLEAGHVHFNLARVLLELKQADRSLDHAQKAQYIYTTSRLTTEVDLIESDMFVAYATSAAHKKLNCSYYEEIFAKATALSCESLNQGLVIQTLFSYIVHCRINRLPLSAFYRQAFDWAGKELMLDVLKEARHKLPYIYHSLGKPQPLPVVERANLKSTYRDRFISTDWEKIEYIPFLSYVILAKSLGHKNIDEPELVRLLKGKELACFSPMRAEIEQSLTHTDLQTAMSFTQRINDELPSLRDKLQAELTPDEYQEFIGGMFVELWNYAMDYDNTMNEESQEYLYLFAMFWGNDLTIIDVAQLILPEWDAARWLLTNNEKIRYLEAVEMGIASD